MFNQWIKCEIGPGMFSDELVVVIKSLGGEAMSFFVPASKVERTEGKGGKLQVMMRDGGAATWAVVPNDQQTEVAVAKSELIAA